MNLGGFDETKEVGSSSILFPFFFLRSQIPETASQLIVLVPGRQFVFCLPRYLAFIDFLLTPESLTFVSHATTYPVVPEPL